MLGLFAVLCSPTFVKKGGVSTSTFNGFLGTGAAPNVQHLGSQSRSKTLIMHFDLRALPIKDGSWQKTFFTSGHVLCCATSVASLSFAAATFCSV